PFASYPINSKLNLASFLSSCQDTTMQASVNPAVGGRLARRKARTESAILDAAERHFLDRGYEGTKVDDIAHDADVAVGSLYNHFGGKEALYRALVERALELFETYMAVDR